ncbi:MAG: flavodoxin family protein [Gammaproteobacteria bacterium]|nr:flavodoxin family protein [Gammaproteobacteria bacterium]
MRRLLIVSHCPSPNTRALADAVERGAAHEDIDGVGVRALAPLDAGAEDVLASDAIIIGSTENFGYMAGRVKDFFERIYYPCLEETRGLPYALFIKGGNDGTGAQRSIERIVTGLSWRAVQDPLIMAGKYRDEWLQPCEELGMAMAAGLEAGIF